MNAKTNRLQVRKVLREIEDQLQASDDVSNLFGDDILFTLDDEYIYDNEDDSHHSLGAKYPDKKYITVERNKNRAAKGLMLGSTQGETVW